MVAKGILHCRRHEKKAAVWRGKKRRKGEIIQRAQRGDGKENRREDLAQRSTGGGLWRGQSKHAPSIPTQARGAEYMMDQSSENRIQVARTFGMKASSADTGKGSSLNPGRWGRGSDGEKKKNRDWGRQRSDFRSQEKKRGDGSHSRTLDPREGPATGKEKNSQNVNRGMSSRSMP